MDDDDLNLNDDNDSGTDANAPKALRQQNSKLTKEVAELNKKLAAFQAKERAGSIAEYLETHGASKKLAKYVERDLEGDVTSDAVLDWLKSDGELFGWEPDQGDDSGEDDNRDAARRISAASNSAKDRQSGVSLDLLRNGDFQTLIDKGFI